MLNQSIANELMWRTQAERITEYLDYWLQVYTEAVFIIFVVVLVLLGWLAIRDAMASKTNKRTPTYRKASQERHLLQTEP